MDNYIYQEKTEFHRDVVCSKVEKNKYFRHLLFLGKFLINSTYNEEL